jgi:hypothetical protein
MIAAHCRLFSLSAADILSSALILLIVIFMLTNRLRSEARMMRNALKAEAVAVDKLADRIDRLVSRTVY